jgi:hypothetical protein
LFKGIRGRKSKTHDLPTLSSLTHYASDVRFGKLFEENTYKKVKKELRGKYKKHY